MLRAHLDWMFYVSVELGKSTGHIFQERWNVQFWLQDHIEFSTERKLIDNISYMSGLILQSYNTATNRTFLTQVNTK